MKRVLLPHTVICVTALIASFLPSACRKDMTIADATKAQAEAIAPPGAPIVVPAIRKDGARAWAQNCMRCHNIRDPQERSDREWEIIVHHMRVRANLTADEHRLILEFLKAAN